MKKHSLLIIFILFVSPLLRSQTTETFETETNNTATFTDNSQVFNITTQAAGSATGVFDIQGAFPGTGWNGSAADNKYIDNDGFALANVPIQFTITAASSAQFRLKSMYLYMSTNNFNVLNVNGTITVTGKLGGVTQFTASMSSGFNTNASFQKGFTFINMSTLGGVDNSNVTIDQYVISTTNGINYVALDAMRWQCAPVGVSIASQTNVLCNGASTGAASVTATGGGLSYNWTPGNPAGDGTAAVTGLTAGVWTCTVTNACGSTNAVNVTITEPSVLTASQSQTNVLCFGNATGVAGVTPSGGSGGYTYLWSTGATGSSISSISAGNYSVTIKDSNNCSIVKNFTITQPASAVTASQSQTDVLCFGNATGVAGVTPSGGTGSYTYLWSTGATGSSISSISAGNYSVTIKDANNCSIVKNFTITQPGSAITASQSQTDVLCFGNATGVAGVTPSGSTGSYTYLWSTGATGSSISSISAGNYSVTIKDANNCSIVKNFTITQPGSAVTASQSQTDVLCFGNATGVAGVTPSGGTGSYTYLWSTGATGSSISSLSAGNYSVTIKDANNCSIVKNFTITQPASAVTASQSQTDVLCFGNATGVAGVTPSGGTGSYTYLWSTGATGSSISSLAAGNYSVTIKDANNCSIVKNFTITQPASAVTASQSQTDVLCFGNATGVAGVTPSGGTGSYTYLWSTGATTVSISNLAAGNYSVTIKDANNCSIVKNFTITQPASAVTASQSQTDVLCFGNATGVAGVTPSGGTGSYTYLWSTGATGSSIASLAAGNYSVTIKDANNCSIVKNFTIAQPAALTAATSQENIACNGGATGSAGVIPSGGTGTYTYSWSPSGGNAATATGLLPGDYTVTITDANNCSITKDFTITQPDVLTAATSQENISCNGAADGIAVVIPAGGAGGYTYDWSPSGGNTATATGLDAGNYTVTITDANDCSITKDFTITEPSALTAATSQTNMGCDGDALGFASVMPSGGTGPYTYSWSPSGGNAATATDLGEGEYTVTITDDNACTMQKVFTIVEAGDCEITTTWNGSSWSHGTPACNDYAAVIAGDFDSAMHGTVTACSLTVNSGAAFVSDGDNFIIKSTVEVLGGSLTFRQNANLLQSDDVDNTGEITYIRNSSALYAFDYTIWSSPTSGSQTLKDFSPETLDQRFYVYNTALNAYSNYQSESGILNAPDEQEFGLAKGYLIRMPDGLPEGETSVFEGVFTGTPNNGDIAHPISTEGNRYNSVGNPYPSPISVEDFITQNVNNLDNGTLYFWRKQNGASGTSYATLTLGGYVNNIIANDTGEGYFDEEDTWVINPGQGFFVKAKTGAMQLDFNNGMRLAENNGQFFRMNQDTPPPPTTPSSKLWLNITNDAGDFGQAAIVYTDITTLALDYGWDGRFLNDGALAIYTTAADTKLSIQARTAFTDTDEVPLGYKAAAAGNFSIGLDHVTGTFEEGQDIYLRDNLLGITHSLTDDGAYSFSSDLGTFDGRFDVVYAAALGTGGPQATAGSIIIYRKDAVVTITSDAEILKDIAIYDIRGRLVYSRNDINAVSAEITDLHAEEQMLVVQVTTIDGIKVYKKIIY